MKCVRNHRIECPGHDSDECCLNCEDVRAALALAKPIASNRKTSQEKEPILERQTIIDLIHEHYDPEPKDWPRHRGWDDGAGDIADKIIAAFQQATGKTVETCPECGILADTLLHRFCTHRYCPRHAP